MVPAHCLDSKFYTYPMEWELIYRDDETDTAVFLDTGKRGKLREGTVVTYDGGYVGEVYYPEGIADSQFAFVPTSLDSISAGSSGTEVFYGDTAVGFINGFDGHGGVLCTYY